jgi:hypothetical protein
MARGPAYHGRTHSPGGTDPIPVGNGIQFDTEPQSGSYIFATVDGVAPGAGAYGITLGDTSDTHGIYLYQGTGTDYSAITLHSYASGGALFVDCQQALFNCAVDFIVRDAGAAHALFRIEADGTLHGKTGAGPIVFDL